MSDLLEELVQRSRSLPPTERARLVDLLLESLHEPPLSEVESAWEQEIQRRVEALGAAQLETFPAEDVFARARRLAP
jgi:putative addiction module component (TIGR02574 family)